MGRVPGLVTWFVAPVLAALLGYGVVGPRLAGGQKALVKKVQERVGKIAPSIVPAASPEPAAPSTDDDATKPAPAPQVSVGVKPVDEKAPAPRPRHRRRRRRAADDDAPPEATSNPDAVESDPASTP